MNNKTEESKKQDITSLTIFCSGIISGVMLHNSGILGIASGVVIGIVLTQYTDVSYDSLVKIAKNSKKMFLYLKDKSIDELTTKPI